MNVLLVGGGGREHALAWKIAQSPQLGKLYIAPGNPGTAQLGENIPVEATDVAKIMDVVRARQIDFVVVGPEAPLAEGMADACLAAGVAVFGPVQAAARLESSKTFSKEVMVAAGVPTAEAHAFDRAEDAAAFVRQSGKLWVVKADGLASGKGVIVPESVDETLEAIAQLGGTSAGQRLLLEELLVGPEVSVIALCDGERLVPLLPAQDHKRLRDGDQGPNTGGMGAFAPSPRISDALIDSIVERCMLPVVRELAARGLTFRGALYAGLILTSDGPYVLEYNARFGDPETQAILPLLESDLLAALHACATGQIQPAMLTWRPGSAACVVLAAAGYPESPRKGDPISGLESVDGSDTIVFHAGTEWGEGQVRTSGGRVLGVTSTGHTLRAALDRAYEAVGGISFAGMQHRSDIGKI
ncbi:phosphoribosylamine--glycine ligase [Chloroflexia bacterium SDU3-3]|nr:phosphoribosylamine--glycine ligase [Chloroflexia bacterium SDU3-3]